MTPNAPLVTANGSLSASDPAAGADTTPESGRPPWPTAVSSDSSNDTVGTSAGQLGTTSGAGAGTGATGGSKPHPDSASR